jgi:thioredoxin-related protein
MRDITIALFFILSGLFYACSESSAPNENKEQECKSEETIKDPNNPKPMALMMRTMVSYCDSMRLDINAGKRVDSIKYPLMPFWDAEPTDSANLVDLFYDNAKDFAAHYRALMSDTNHQKENYTAVINSCVNCHNSFCSGPLRRIKKLPLDYVEK